MSISSKIKFLTFGIKIKIVTRKIKTGVIEFVKSFEITSNKPTRLMPPIVPLNEVSKRARFNDVVKKYGKNKIAPNKFAKRIL